MLKHEVGKPRKGRKWRNEKLKLPHVTRENTKRRGPATFAAAVMKPYLVNSPDKGAKCLRTRQMKGASIIPEGRFDEEKNTLQERLCCGE